MTQFIAGEGGFCIKVIGFPTKSIPKPAPTNLLVVSVFFTPKKLITPMAAFTVQGDTD
ncbi:MAG: hypothetical protein AB1589_08840 [Cyanobacteriota bacterium]